MLAKITTQATSFWEKQKPTQRVILIAVAVLVVVMVPVLITWATQPTYSVAYSGLDESDAGSIVEQLKTSGIDYKLQGTTILVQSDKLYDVRLQMANAGLPKGGSAGYELLSQNTLGMTEFTQRVTYQRAIEGELERTIGSLDAVEGVRVHIVTPEKTLLADEQAPTTASITIQERTGRHLDAGQIRAITYLTANAVEGLSAENVVVVNTEGDVLAAGTSDETAGAVSQVDSRRAAELAAASDVQKKVKTLLDTALGPNKSVVQASVRLDWSDKEITTTTFEPTPNAIRSSQKTSESYTLDSTGTGGVAGAVSNLPTPVAGTTTTTSSPTLYQREEETINYEVAQTENHQIIRPGMVDNISLSVLVDGISDQQQLQTLQTAIAAAAGIDQKRGDQLSVQTLTFDKTYLQQQEEDLAVADRTRIIIMVAEIVGGLLLLAALFWYISRLLKNLKVASIDVWEPVLKPAGELAMPASVGGLELPVSTPEQKAASGLTAAAKTGNLLQEASARITPKVTSAEEQKMQALIARLAEDNPASVADVIQMWLNQDKKNG
ncbi:MAG: flagellar M-ring protein FliF [Leptolinea sp.]|jgi:flagellar M-ring protein FliF|nr:flagellar M-ring protein FliF [Leptolinea sp.]